MMRISSHAAHTEKNEGFEASDILLCIPDILHRVIITLSAKPFRLLMHLSNPFAQSLFIEIHIGNCRKQPFNHHPPCIRTYLRCLMDSTRQSHQCTRQFILKLRHIRSFSTYTCCSRTAAASGRLLTLIAKHLIIHCFSS